MSGRRGALLGPGGAAAKSVALDHRDRSRRKHHGLRAPGRALGSDQLLSALRRSRGLRARRALHVSPGNTRQHAAAGSDPATARSLRVGPRPVPRSRCAGSRLARQAPGIPRPVVSTCVGDVLHHSGREQCGHQPVPFAQRNPTGLRHRPTQRSREPGERPGASRARRLRDLRRCRVQPVRRNRRGRSGHPGRQSARGARSEAPREPRHREVRRRRGLHGPSDARQCEGGRGSDGQAWTTRSAGLATPATPSSPTSTSGRRGTGRRSGSSSTAAGCR